MRKLAMIVGVVGIVVGLAGGARAQSAADLVAKNVAARGGDAAFRQLQSRRVTGKVVFGGGDFSVEGAWANVVKRPGMVRTELTLQGLTQVTAYDGKEGWTVSPFGGRHDPEKASHDAAIAMAQEAELEGPLVDWRAKGYQLELLGTDDVDGTRAHKLRLTRKDGDVEYVYLDPDSFLEIRITTIHKVRGVEHITETDLGGYQRVAGVWFPFSIESGDQGAPRNVRVTIERMEANVAIDDAMFKFPTKPVVREVIEGPPAAGAEAVPPVAATTAARGVVIDSGTISGLGARNIGSATMSGRISAVAAHNAGGKTTLYVGAASGGVWRSLDGGTTFKPVFDNQPVQSIGAITIDPSNPKTVWVGTGEAWMRNSVSVGDGIYKSTDGGETWNHMGLPDAEHIVRIVVDPRHGNTVYACVPGKLWSDSTERGVYRTSDGGKTWALVLAGANPSTGCSGLAMDPRNPDTLLAGMWDFRRKGWTFRSGGDSPDAPSASGMFRSSDGGRTWKPMTPATAKGLPAGPWGRVEVEYAPSNPRIVYAMIESKATALFRSADGGATWEQRDKSQMMVWRPFYFARLVVDPKNPDRLFKPDLALVVSEDGGRSFSDSGGGSHGDWHDVWIDPDNPKHVIGGDDGGLWLSYDGGSRWWKANNLPISQFYHVSVDAKDPYQVYGGLQDNSAWVGDSAYPGGITNARWENVGGGDGFWTFADPTDADAVYYESQGGYIGRTDRKSHASRDIQPTAGLHEKLRFNWNTPIHVSPTQRGTIYLGAQFLFRSRDRGDSWERISPDLTTNDPAKQQQEQSGGVSIDNSSAEMHTTIYSISESPKDPAVIWAGTDDGNLNVTRNGGKAWTNVVRNVPGLPAASWVSWVEASRFDVGTAYAAFDRHTFGDVAPWVFKTVDFGATWTRIVSPDRGVRGYAHVIKEDSVVKSLLFLGTELGLWISVDGGATWAEFKGNHFPSVAVRDLVIQARENDVVLATHGRGLWIIDDISPLRALSADTLAKSTAFLPSRPVQQRMPAFGGWPEGDATFAGDNPPAGATITYYLRSRHIYGPIKLEVLDAKGAVVDTLAASKHRGINRVAWSMQIKPPRVPRAAQVSGSAQVGPRVLPGVYTVRLTRGTEVVESRLTIGLDRRAPYSVADRTAQFDAMMSAHRLFGDMSTVVDRLDAIRAAIADRGKALPAGDELTGKLAAAGAALDEVKKQIVATTEGGAITGEERIREHLDTVYGALLRWEGRPPAYQVDRINVLRRELTEASAKLDAVIATQIRPLDALLKQHQLAPVSMATPSTGLDDVAIHCVETAGRECGTDHDDAARERD